VAGPNKRCVTRTDRAQPLFRADFTSRTGQLSPVAITRTLTPPPPTREKAHVVVDGDDCQIGLGLPVSVRSISPGKICHREPSSSSTMWLSE
jgi:hypothetical protein